MWSSETDRQLTLRVVGRDPVAINKADIQSREATASSMMPPGLFDALTDREVIDLVGVPSDRGAGESTLVRFVLQRDQDGYGLPMNDEQPKSASRSSQLRGLS